MGKINPSTDSPALRIPTDVAEQMSKRGHDVSAFEARLSATPRPEAERTWANIIDYYRHSTQASNVVGSVQSQLSPYRQNRLAETANPNWTAWDDMGSQFKNQFNYLAQGVANFVPSTVDLAMSVASNPSDESWYRKWQDNVNQYFDKYKYYTSPEAEAAVYDSEKGLNWRAVAGMTGSTLGFLASSVIPAVTPAVTSTR